MLKNMRKEKYEGKTSHSNIAYEKSDFWNNNLLINEPDLWDDNLSIKDQIQNKDIKLMIIEQPIETPVKKIGKVKKSDETDEEINNNLTFLLSINSEDFYGITLANTIMDKIYLLNTEWFK
ncbi:hypothetical protein C1645_835541 [Glomus cerebriforme]|uniref:Uncharacterized protein n=1 Tax=Glomus cerebriforme TaxID=658196 RepID=A0A397SDJ3_9GLOM|nr:hypothetical protein C1645_835541 [Glomus cerebriforme]